MSFIFLISCLPGDSLHYPVVAKFSSYSTLFLKRLSGFIALSGWEVGLPQGQPHTEMNRQGKQRWIYLIFPSKARPEARWWALTPAVGRGAPKESLGREEGWNPLHGASSHMLSV